MSTTNILDLNNRIDELADSYPASKVVMSDGVTSVGDRLDANTFGTAVNLTNYTSENPYIAPYDGYVLGVTSDVGQVVQGCIDGIWLIHAYSQTGNRYQKDSVYVKKGMTIYSSITNGGELSYYPLS